MKYLILLAAVLIAVAIYNYYHFAMRRVDSPEPRYRSQSRIIKIPYGQENIYGELLFPEGKKSDTLIIGSHGFNGSMIYFKNALGYRLSQEGYDVYVYDFINGSRHSKSGGYIEDMSALDEVKQLETVYAYFEDKYENIILAGESQGGLITTLAYGDMKDKTRALILYYPAYCAVSDAKKRIEDQKSNLFGIRFRSDYSKELSQIDLESAIRAIDIPVLLIHGDSDRTVDVSYAYWSQKLINDCELHVLQGKDHGFDQKGRIEASGYVSSFLKKIRK